MVFELLGGLGYGGNWRKCASKGFHTFRLCKQSFDLSVAWV